MLTAVQSWDSRCALSHKNIKASQTHPYAAVIRWLSFLVISVTTSFWFLFQPRALSLTSKCFSQALSITLCAHASGWFIRLYLLWSVCVGYRQAIQLQSDWITAVSAVESTVTECALVIHFSHSLQVLKLNIYHFTHLWLSQQDF